jgi:transposase
MTRELDKEYIKLKNNISKYNNTLWLPGYNIKYDNKSLNTWFDFNINKSNIINKQPNMQNNNIYKKKEYYKCIKVNMILNKEQKLILDSWFKSYICMYNNTIKFIKNFFIKYKKTILDYKKIRTYYLKNIRNEIITNSSNIEKYRIKTHIIDCAIKLACSNYKSALSNLNNKNIKYFKIKYWKFNKKLKLLEIEPSYFGKNKNNLCHSVFGDIKYLYNKKEYKLNNITSACTLHYNGKINEYNLIIPIKSETEQITNNKEFISIDPGIRTFITGISENEVIKIGNNISDKIEKYLNRIDILNKYKYKNKINRLKEQKYNKKIQNLVNELHWKSINYLTSNYKNIFIGDLSTKNISFNITSNISKITKRVAYKLSFYKFRMRLQSRCENNNINYKMINEKYTSKMCSNCGNYNEKLGSNKIYNCNNCKNIIDRNINGCRCIYFKVKN